jgi:hypothetical protein
MRSSDGRKALIRRVGILLFASMLIGVVAAQTCVPQPAGLISWWTGDGDATDIVGGDDGTLQNGAAFGPGLVGQAFTFDGADDAVSVPDSSRLDFGTGDFTVAFWVKFDDLDDTGNGIMAKDSYAGDLGNITGWLFNICGLCGGGGFGVGSGGVGIETRNKVGGGGPWTHARYATANFETGTWYYLAGVRQSNVLHLYVDAVLRATTPESSPANLDNNEPLTFGRLTLASPQNFKGQLDEIDITTWPSQTLKSRPFSTPAVQANAGRPSSLRTFKSRP